jgi:uncharacterized protein (TIGR02145 family)
MSATNNIKNTSSNTNMTLLYNGDLYHVIIIGTQTWMVENLKTTLYRDGTAIPNITDHNSWFADVTGAYCWYDNDYATYGIDYGALYNGYAIESIHGLAPSGWRIPTVNDFTILIAYLGGGSLAGGKLKEIGLSHWGNPNVGASDDYGFKAFGAGYRTSADDYHNIKSMGSFYTSTSASASTLNTYLIIALSALIVKGSASKSYGACVRCIKDN